MDDESEIKASLVRIEEKLDKLLADNDVVEKECKKMGDHIDWVEHIFHIMRNPLRLVFRQSLPLKTKSIAEDSSH